jgi:hypothetical protein
VMTRLTGNGIYGNSRGNPAGFLYLFPLSSEYVNRIRIPDQNNPRSAQ